MYYFTSDLHFNDELTLINDMRPFNSCDEFDNYVIDNFNKIAKKDDVIYVIGDFIDCDGENYDGWKKSIRYVERINAQVVLIMGNNEERVVKYFFDGDFNKFREYCLNIGFKDVHKDLVVSFLDRKFYLIHKPIHCKKEYINLFGHMHRSGGIYKPFGFNIGCDLNHFNLYSERDIEFFLSMKEKYWDKDKNINMWSI